MQEGGFCISYDIGGEYVGEGVRGDIGGRGFETV